MPGAGRQTANAPEPQLTPPAYRIARHSTAPPRHRRARHTRRQVVELDPVLLGRQGMQRGAAGRVHPRELLVAGEQRELGLAEGRVRAHLIRAARRPHLGVERVEASRAGRRAAA